MEIKDINGKTLTSYDPEAGKVELKTKTVTHPAVEGKEEVFHYELLREFENGGKEYVKIIDSPKIEGKAAYTENEAYLLYTPFTERELKERRISELKEKLREKDYIVIKIATGCAKKEDYTEVIEACERWRKEINRLEAGL